VVARARPGIRVIPVSVPGEKRLEHYINAGVAAATQPWASCTGIDDEYRPHALADLNAAHDSEADVLLWHHDDYETIRRHNWDPLGMRTNNTVHGSCAFRISMWRRVGGWPLVAWSDWAFWLKCIHAGALLYRSEQVGVLWDPGRGRNTWTAQAGDGDVGAARNREIADLVGELWG
jgi:hypothetical protein